MIVVTKDGVRGDDVKEFGYFKKRNVFSRFIAGQTRNLRAKNAEKFIHQNGRLLDIGCGDGYFVKRCPCNECYGLDPLLGDEVSNALPFEDQFFDVVTMLAVIEHVTDPQKLIKEIYRVLNKKGRLIFTTPKKAAEKFIKLYSKDVENEHEQYFTLESVQSLASGLFVVKEFRTFIFGLNQLFVLEKR